MKLILTCFVLLFSLTTYLLAGESHYEVYYFYSSERSEDCNTAEAWAGEAVEIIKQENPDAQILYLPKQLEENEDFAEETNAEQSDLVVAEIQDGKMIRHQFIGNMLGIVGSKQILLHIVPEGIALFSEQTESGQRLKAPDEEHIGPQQPESAQMLIAPDEGQVIQQSTPEAVKRYIAIYVMAENAADTPDPRVADIVSEVLSRDFAMQISNEMILPTIIDVDVPQNRAWVETFKAEPGDVVVAIISNNIMESHKTLKGPQTPEQESEFSESLTDAVRENINSIDL